MFRLQLLGRFYLSSDDKPTLGFRSEKIQALLAYLAIEGTVPVSRKQLAELLWWGYAEHSSRLSLRQGLHNLNLIFEPNDILRSTRQSVQLLRFRGGITCDVWELQALVDKNPATLTATDWKLLQTCENLELLEGLESVDSAPFKLWLEKQRLAHKSLQRKISALLTYKPIDTSQNSFVSTRKHNLRRPFTTFWGRENEIQQLIQQVYNPEIPLIVLLGGGGSGKTRLSLALAQRIVAMESDSKSQQPPDKMASGAILHGSTSRNVQFPDGIWLIPLPGSAQLDPTTTIAMSVVKELGLYLRGNDSLVEQTLHYFERKAMLLIFDNFESVIEGRDFLVELLHRATQVKMIVTSRQRLNLQAEVIHKVGGLPIPDRAVAFSRDVEWSRFPGLQLFVERAQRTTHGFELTSDNYADVVAICAAVDGNPLAIELAASQIEQREPKSILLSLQENLTELATDLYDVPVEHRSLKSVMDHSWRSLTEFEMRALALCSVFQAHFTAEAAATVLDRSDYLVLLQNLVDKSWLNVEYSKSEEQYHMHAIVRTYGTQQWADLASDIQYQTYLRHCDYYLHLVSQIEKSMSSGDLNRLVDLINHEISNVQAAWRWATAHGAFEIVIQCSLALSEFYAMEGLIREGEQEFLAAIESFRFNQDESKDFSLSAQEVALGFTLCAHSNLLIRLAKYEQAIPQIEKAIQIAQRNLSLRLEVTANYLLADIKVKGHQYIIVPISLRNALGMTRQIGDLRTEIKILMTWGTLALQENRFEEAAQNFTEGLALARKSCFVDLEVMMLKASGDLLMRLGKIADSRVLFEQALQLSIEINSLLHKSISLSLLGVVYDKLGDYSQALERYQEALEIFTDMGDTSNQARILGNLGISHDYVGQYETAIRYSEQSVQLWKKLSVIAPMATSLINLSMHHQHSGDFSTAEKYAKESLSICRSSGERNMERYAWMALGHALCDARRFSEAQDAYLQALAIAQDLGIAYMEIEPLAGLVQVALRTNQFNQSVADSAARLHDFLTQQESGGLEEPMLATAICFDYLQAANRPQAMALLQQAYQELMTRASKISQIEQRHSFLSNVVAHAKIVSAWNRYNSE